MNARRVRTRAELTEFIASAPALAAQRGEVEHYVPLFASDIDSWFSGRGWFTEEVELWLLDDEAGQAVARTMLHRSPELADKLDDGTAPSPLFFGAVEAADAAALTRLVEFITSRARLLGADRVFGPVSPLPNVTGGLISAGTDSPGFFDSAWNPAFFEEVFARAGFVPWGRAHTWEVAVDAVPAPRATAVRDAEWKKAGLRRRPVSRFGVSSFARRLRPTLNAAFAALPYYTTISQAQLKSQMDGLAVLMDPDLIIDIVGADDPDDAPSRCFILAMPDPLPVLRRHGGRLGPRALLDLVHSRRRLRDAVLIIQGTDPQHQGRGLLSLAVRDLNAALAAKGYRRLRVTFIADDNPASAAPFERSGGHRLHELVFVDLRLGSDLHDEGRGSDSDDVRGESAP